MFCIEYALEHCKRWLMNKRAIFRMKAVSGFLFFFYLDNRANRISPFRQNRSHWLRDQLSLPHLRCVFVCVRERKRVSALSLP